MLEGSPARFLIAGSAGEGVVAQHAGRVSLQTAGGARISKKDISNEVPCQITVPNRPQTLFSCHLPIQCPGHIGPRVETVSAG